MKIVIFIILISAVQFVCAMNDQAYQHAWQKLFCINHINKQAQQTEVTHSSKKRKLDGVLSNSRDPDVSNDDNSVLKKQCMQRYNAQKIKFMQPDNAQPVRWDFEVINAGL